MSNPGFETHLVENQVPALVGDLLSGDTALREGLAREGARWAEPRISQFASQLGRATTQQLGHDANRHVPELHTHDRFGNRIDEVAFHPAWHALMSLAMQHEVHNLPWREFRSGSMVARTALHSLLSQVEAGCCCPLTMTFACIPTLRHEPRLAEFWEPKVCGTQYDSALRPADEKDAVLIGMAMTEKQGGSDVRSNTTQARPTGVDGEYVLVGHKWFCSAPMSDAFLTLAQTQRGITCFLVPRVLPDGSRNAFRIQRLKDKLGNRSNASAELEYTDTLAQQVGEEGSGIRTIIDMVHHTRLDCVSGSTGLMRRALVQAVHHASHRQAFGKRLIRQPLMINVLADLALEVEAATALMLRLARAYEDPAESAFARIATAIGKYHVCKRTPGMIYEAMECLGGNGYVEDSGLPRLYREAPVNAIWEGSGNVICLDVLRAMVRQPDCWPALRDELVSARGGNESLDKAIVEIDAMLANPEDAERQARRLVERMALALQAALLVRHAPAPVADAFCTNRLGNQGGLAFGTLAKQTDFAAILSRATPNS